MKKRGQWKVLLVCMAIVYFIAFLGSIFTTPNVNTAWYDSIKPNITPPGWVFPIVWNVLFFLIGLSLYLAWISSKKNQKIKISFVFGINLILNAFWSYLYFGLRNPGFAFVEFVALWLSIVAMIYYIYKINKTSWYLIIPYFLWVSFAGVLNYLSI